MNQAINKLGPKSKIRILQRLKVKYPAVAAKIYRIDNYSGVMGETDRVQIIYYDNGQGNNSSYEKKQNETFTDTFDLNKSVFDTGGDSFVDMMKLLFMIIFFGVGLAFIVYLLLVSIFLTI